MTIESSKISIHALLAESDRTRPPPRPRQRNFYPRSPCGERQTILDACNRKNKFLSTLSLRRATPCRSIAWRTAKNFYPRSPCGERRRNRRPLADLQAISIHALLAESDQKRFWQIHNFNKFLSTLSLRRATFLYRFGGTAQTFLSTLSLRRATRGLSRYCQRHNISIHALLAESDQTVTVAGLFVCDFYPRSPCGERLRNAEAVSKYMIFLSTLSLRRATPHK